MTLHEAIHGVHSAGRRARGVGCRVACPPDVMKSAVQVVVTLTVPIPHVTVSVHGASSPTTRPDLPHDPPFPLPAATSSFLLSAKVLGVDPPRPLPASAYDLQTALESVQHFATQTLAGVVQAEATRGSSDFSDPAPSSGGRSPKQGGGGAGGRAGKAAAKEKREAGAAAGLVEGWEEAWPPRELTKELGLVTARQMAHAMRCDAEPLIQVHKFAASLMLLLSLSLSPPLPSSSRVESSGVVSRAVSYILARTP